MKTQTTRQTVEVRADGEGLISHAGAYLLVELADRLGLTAALSEAMAPSRERRSAHDPGVLVRDLAVAITSPTSACCAAKRPCSGRWPQRRRPTGC